MPQYGVQQESNLLYLEDCSRAQRSTQQLQAFAGQISKLLGDVGRGDRLEAGQRLLDVAVSQAFETKSLLAQMEAMQPEAQAAEERNNRQLMLAKLRESLYIVARVLEHLVRRFFASVGHMQRAEARDGILAQLQSICAECVTSGDDEHCSLPSISDDGVESDDIWEDSRGKAVLHECVLLRAAVVTEGPSPLTDVIVVLPVGTRITVIQVIIDDKERRYIRGHIRESVGYIGFITLVDAKLRLNFVSRLGNTIGSRSNLDLFDGKQLAQTTQQLAQSTQQFASNALSFVASNLKGVAQLPDFSEDSYSVGQYVTIRDTAVNEALSFDSLRLTVLRPGTRVLVSEVFCLPDEKRIRGRIEIQDGTTGFISLRFADYVFVRYLKESTKATSEHAIRLGPWKGEPTSEIAPSDSIDAILESTQQLASQAASFVASSVKDLRKMHELSKLPRPNYDEFGVGRYVLTRDAALTDAISYTSRQIELIPSGVTIQVLEIVSIPADLRVRGRICGPSGQVGFVTLSFSQYAFARRLDAIEAFDRDPMPDDED